MDYLIQLNVIRTLAKDNPIYKPTALELDQAFQTYGQAQENYTFQELNDFFVLKLTAEKYMLSNLPLVNDLNEQRINYQNWYLDQLKRVAVKTVEE